MKGSDMWKSYDDGGTVGTVGSERGIILMDEENPLGARITLEELDGRRGYGITCGVYGLMVHTVFGADPRETRERYEAMKTAIGEFLDGCSGEDGDDSNEKAALWVDAFVDAWG